MSNGKRQMQDIKANNYDLFDPQATPVLVSPVPQAMPVLVSPDTTFPELATTEQIILEAELSLEEEATKELPTEIELYEIFDRLNIRIFNNEIPRLNIKYSKRMLIAGTFNPIKKEIKIGWKYHQLFKDDIEDTMAHEMIHYFHPNHGRGFKDFARRFGISLKAKDHPDLRSACKYLYFCPNCKKEYPRRKRLRMASCGSCSTGKKYDGRFKLKLIKK